MKDGAPCDAASVWNPQDSQLAVLRQARADSRLDRYAEAIEEAL